MQKTSKIKHVYDNQVLNICLDTLERKKQVLVFVNSKSSAEAEAERISAKIKVSEEEKEKLEEASNKVLQALDKPTKQCQRLALCVRKGVAFHHAGLHHEQRELIEDNFRSGVIKIICATPTLAYGVNLPAFRVIVRDLKRFSAPHGMSWIPVLEFQQFCGRAGRPDFNDEYGEAICIAETEGEKEKIIENYIEGETEEILSKLAVEPVLRTYVLSLIATNFANTTSSLMDFFKKTFYAHQFGDVKELEKIIGRILKKLEEWEFITIGENDKDKEKNNDKDKEKNSLEPTLLGERVSQLYLDPYTAHYLITCLKRAEGKILRDF
ncbi:MAG TPA: helicase-related protein, partial [Candidatus Nanoarchaeia archaeon]|nr:helicase-related protein [Candidatus Nanoarchaeia archaeon]